LLKRIAQGIGLKNEGLSSVTESRTLVIHMCFSLGMPDSDSIARDMAI
jgi:hypothetical protein